jgi:hypothetical protein
MVKNLIKQLLREGYNNVILLEQLSLLIEKEIRVGQSLIKKLNNVNKPYADKLLKYLTSNEISDSVNIDAIDYSEDDDKTITAYIKDRDGNLKGRKYKVGKLLNTLGIKLSEFKGYEIEDLIAHLKKGTTEDFKLVSGDDILWAYHCDNYDEGETMGSCMRYEAAQRYLQIYTENPDSVNCLVLINPINNKVRGRALIWHTDSDEFFMDTIYLTNEQYKHLFLQYAEEHGYTRRTRSTVSLENVMFDEYPYMDTFQFLNREDKILMTSNDGDENTVKLDDTSGNYNNTGIYIEYGSRKGEYADEDDVIHLSYKTPHGNVEGYAHWDDVMTDDGGVYLSEHMQRVYDVYGNYNWKFMYDEDSPTIEITDGDYSGELALFEDTIKLYVEKYGDDAYALNNGQIVQLYPKKYGEDDNYALKVDSEEIFSDQYGDDMFALEEDTTEVDLDDHGYVRVLTDDYEVNESTTSKNLIKQLLKKSIEIV